MNTDLWITQIVPNTRNAAVLADLRDAVKMHRRVMDLFPLDLGPQARQQVAGLFRLDETPTGFTILIQSTTKPSVDQLPVSYGTARSKTLAPLLDHLRAGINVHYRITANATRKLGNNTTAGRPKQVVPLHGAEADAWWQRQADAAGLTLRSLRSSQLSDITGHRGSQRITHARTRFDGTAIVNNPEALIQRIQAGIGRGKSFGCGLLTIAPAQ